MGNMMKLMKFVLLIVMFAQLYTSNIKALAKYRVAELSTLLSTAQNSDFYYAFDDWYYAYSPVYYTYTPTSYYYLCEWWWFPSACDTTYVVFRQNQLKTGDNLAPANKMERRELKSEDVEKQIKVLKKEIFGKEDFSTKDLRKNNKAYDPRWLLAQLKIARLLFLEDEITKNLK